MKKIFRFFLTRIFWAPLLILLQLGLMVYLLLNLGTLSYYVYALMHLVSLAVVVWLVTKDDNPSYKITWIILILTLPLLGGAFYLIFGNKTLPRRLRKNLASHRRRHYELFSPEEGEIEQFGRDLPAYNVPAEYLQRISRFPPYRNTAVEYCPSGEEFFAKLQQELPRAERFIFMEYFIIEEGKMWNRILDILKERAAAGVEVCLLYDDFGCIRRLPSSYPKTLAKFGIKAAASNPIRPSLDPSLNYRDHRKTCVIDGKVGFCGGINLADEYINEVNPYGHWKDTAVLLRGDAVRSLTRMFLQLWTLWCPGQLWKNDEDYLVTESVPDAKGYVQPFTDTPLDSHNVAESVYLQLINRANRYITITTPYLILDNEFQMALKTAAQSGVDVRIITPSHPDKWYVHMVSRSYYQPLIRSGVKIYEYQPGFIHAKMLLCDDKVAIVGTTNLDYRSLYLHYENAVTLYHTPVIEEIRRDLEETLESSRRITMAELRSKLRGTKVLCALLRMLAPLM